MTIRITKTFLFVLSVAIMVGSFVAESLADVFDRDAHLASLVSDSLPPNGSKTYKVDALEHSLLILTLKADSGLSALKVHVEDLQSSRTIERCYVPEISEQLIYYIVDQGDLRIELNNTRADSLEYSLLVDVTIPLGAENTKLAPFTGGLVGFHVDMNRDDVLSLDLSPSPQASFTMTSYAPYYRVTNAIAGYMLRSNTEESNESLTFRADLEGRYFIIAESVKGAGEITFSSKISSIFWNKWWFWPTIAILIAAALSLWLFSKIRAFGSLGRLHVYIVISSYCLLVTLTLWSTSIGAYLYKSPLLPTLLHLSAAFFGMSLAFRAHSDHLHTKDTFRISNTWYLTTGSSGILSFLVCTSVFGFGFSGWWGGIGCVVCGVVASIINRNVDRRKALSFLFSGAALFLLFPILAYFFKETVFQPFVMELYAPAFGSYIFRAASPYQTLPSGFILLYFSAATATVFLITKEIRSIENART